MPDARKPSVSVIVTCHNYGHFLGACLDSLDAQTEPAEQIVVVDDGSLDATRSVLRSRAAPPTVIAKENGGQASAFNAGFAVATGDIVVFLDADDMLAPDALEIIRMAWHEDFAALGFRLNLIDAEGRPVGPYDVALRAGDMRPELLSRGHFSFMPTSGNAFSRRRVAQAFPLPEKRWRISADTVLIRAAALAGPIGQLPFPLGFYRVHGGNGYHRAVLAGPQVRSRAFGDMADANAAVAWMDLAKDGESDGGLAQLELLLASIRTRLIETDDPARDRSLPATPPVPLRKLGIGLRARIAIFFWLKLLPFALRVAPPLRRWLVHCETMPRILSRLPAAVLGRDLTRRRRAMYRARWLPQARAGRFDPGRNAAAWFNALDWTFRRSDNARVLVGRSGEIVLPTDYFPDGASLSLDLVALGPHAKAGLDAVLVARGRALARVTFHGSTRMTALLDPTLTLPGPPLELELSVRPLARSIPERARWLAAPAGTIQLGEVRIEALARTDTGLMIGVGDFHDFAEIAAACQVSPRANPGWTGPVEGNELVLHFLRPDVPEAIEIVMRFGREQAEGTLAVTDGSVPLYSGFIGAGSTVRIPVALPEPTAGPDLMLTLGFDPHDPFVAPAFHIASVGVTASASDIDGAPELPVLGPGQIWKFEDESAVPGPLGEGWKTGEEGAELFETLGLVRFALDPSVPDDAVLYLRLTSSMPLYDPAPLPDGPVLLDQPEEAFAEEPVVTVAVTAGDEVLVQARLDGEDELAVPLRGALARQGRRIELAVHAAFVLGEHQDASLERPALALTSMRLSPHVACLPPDRERIARRSATLVSDIRAAAALGRALREDGHPPADSRREFTEMHGRIVSAIETLAPQAARPILLDETTLEALCDIGEAMAALAPGGQGQPPPDRAGDMFSADAGQAIIAAALAMLTAPPWRAMAGRRVRDLPDCLRASPAPIARYLCSAGQVADNLDAYRDHLVGLLRYARACFAAEPRGNPHERLAEELLRGVRLAPNRFAQASLRQLARSFGDAMEAYLLSRGRRITLLAPRMAPTGRPRIGILTGDLHPWIVGAAGALPREKLELLVFTLRRGAEAARLPGARTIEIGDVGVDRAVEVMRAQRLDLLLLGSSFERYEPFSAMAAHRVAPVQVAARGVSPLASGLRSFDVMLTPAPCEGAAADRPIEMEWPGMPDDRETAARFWAVLADLVHAAPAGQRP